MCDVKYLFVYGTLRKESVFNYFLLEGFKFIGKAILKNAELYRHDYLPVLISGKGKVFGEVYKIQDNSRLFILDKIESGQDCIISDIKFKNKTIKAFVYFYKYPDLVKNNPDYFKIKTGDWNNK